jgi:hypothetical protein
MPYSANVAPIARLNDSFRSTLMGSRVLFSHGLSLLPEAEQNDILTAVRNFNAFTRNNDPYGEHDFGTFIHEGKRILFKIDYYDSTMTGGSENPADPSQTTRVLTIMLAEEY